MICRPCHGAFCDRRNENHKKAEEHCSKDHSLRMMGRPSHIALFTRIHVDEIKADEHSSRCGSHIDRIMDSCPPKVWQEVSTAAPSVMQEIVHALAYSHAHAADAAAYMVQARPPQVKQTGLTT